MKETKKTNKTKAIKVVAKEEKVGKTPKKVVKNIEKEEKPVKKTRKKVKDVNLEETKVIDTIDMATISNVDKTKPDIVNSFDIMDTRVNQLETGLSDEKTRVDIAIDTERQERKADISNEKDEREKADIDLKIEREKLNKVLVAALVTWSIGLVLMIIFFILVLRFII